MGTSFMADLSGITGVNSMVATKSTSRANNTELSMDDFLQLMIVQLQNQTIDDTMDTSEMMNQMVQMQMITAITNLTDASLMTYASSLVGKEVTVGVSHTNGLEERVITITGTGVSNGSQVVFGSDGNTYALNQIMAVGRLPEIEQPNIPSKPAEGTDKPVESPKDPVEDPVDPPADDDGPVEGADKPGDGTDRPVGSGDEGGDSTPIEDGGDQVAPVAPTEGA